MKSFILKLQDKKRKVNKYNENFYRFAPRKKDIIRKRQHSLKRIASNRLSKGCRVFLYENQLVHLKFQNDAIICARKNASLFKKINL